VRPNSLISLIVKNNGLNCIGSIYKWPEIAGLDDFKGHRVHSAHWDDRYDYSHKKIAIIGNGSSGVQIVPQMAKLAGTTVTNFARGPSWIYYRVPPSQHLGKSGKSGNNPKYTEEDKANFRENPEAMKEHRKAMIGRTNRAFRMVCLTDPLPHLRDRFYLSNRLHL
jgi:cation diffusion facilitator CzcD-associated flavoprotein CzcO